MWSGTHPAQWSAPNPEGFARAFGLHPLWVHPDTLADDLAQLFTRLSDTSSAVGEVGLDRRRGAIRAAIAGLGATIAVCNNADTSTDPTCRARA